MAGLRDEAAPPELDEPGAVEAVDGLYRAHRLMLLRLAVFLIGDWALAEDLVQDAFVGLYRRWSQLDDPAASVSYLRVSVVHAARSAQRRQILARRHVRVTDPEAGPAADYALLLSEEHRAVIVALRRLPRRQREVLVLRYWSQLTEADIAATLGISRGAVKSSASRGLHALHKLVGELS